MRVPISVEITKKENFEVLTKQIAKGGGIAFVGQLSGKGINFVLQILLARILGTMSYGLYALGYNVFFIAQRFSLLGFHNGVVRFGSIYRGKSDTRRLKGTLITSLGVTFLTGILLSFLLFFSQILFPIACSMNQV